MSNLSALPKPLKGLRFHSDNLNVFEGEKLIASCPNIKMAIELQAALNQLDDICVCASIPRPLKGFIQEAGVL